MSLFHCSCGFAIDSANEFCDHLHQVFARDDNIGTDSCAHAEVVGPCLDQYACSCGFAASDAPELDDHLLIVFVTPDGVGNDGARHVPVNTSTPDRWHVSRGIDE